ncbi:CDP-diacylglycerol--serine O-phosphatidyltransferase [Flammeovirgaceae bacterium SG7u.111]|nr:CDP-diacylglycerol--serine O-phosphatidyltransferase [Flammeovirgaceae bacterium SG7u.132]WPO36181.1 CDP-diacylglycerol--serine O-phosphatidyltransferase [Flammeovirgaceae bacterium SG7u.111]
MKKQIPNLFTLGNLISGCIGIDMVYHGDLIMAAYMIGIGGLFDFVDGFVARLLKVSSPIGKELDSLADMVTFGVLPSIIIMKLMYNGPEQMPGLYLAFLLAAAAAFRLAKFNIDTRQSDSFLGMPTPAMAIFIGSLPLIQQQNPFVSNLLLSLPSLITMIFVLSILMVVELPLFSLKFKNISLQDNAIRYVFLLASLLLLIFIKFTAIPAIIFLYIALSLVKKIFKLP